MTEEDLIRRYCQLMFSEREDYNMIEESFDIAKKILVNTNYRLLSTRLVHPELYEFPKSSVEAKKALLLSLSPMLKDADEQKKKDSAACEAFTRCRSIKGKGSYGIYEYIDVDIQLRVDFPEFEKRYMLYIRSTKAPQGGSHERKVSILPPENNRNNVLLVSAKENVASHHNHNLVEGLSLSPSQIIRKEKLSSRSRSTKLTSTTSTAGKQQERRITLSPASVKAMLLTALHDDNIGNESDLLVEATNVNNTTLLTSLCSHNRLNESSKNGQSNSSVPSEEQLRVLDNLGKELDCILANLDDTHTAVPIVATASDTNHSLQLVDDILFDDTAAFHIAPRSPAALPPVENETRSPSVVEPINNSSDHNTINNSNNNQPSLVDNSSSLILCDGGEMEWECVCDDLVTLPARVTKQRRAARDSFVLPPLGGPLFWEDDCTITDGDQSNSQHKQGPMDTTDSVTSSVDEKPHEIDEVGDTVREVASNVESNTLSAIESHEFQFSDKSVPSPHSFEVNEIVCGLNSDDILLLEEVSVDAVENTATKKSCPLADLVGELAAMNIHMDEPVNIIISSETNNSDKNEINNSINEAENKKCSIAKTVLPENIENNNLLTSDSFLPDTKIDELAARERAFARMCERFEVARWKYQWEQVSVVAANSAGLRIRR
mmetsp:Transcript_2055/g.3236  ORF Transcript_2055/g.3236 Transcript_2055/m.3236 type:complete len:663 (-) Transcript_2055:166-2154(-)